MRSGAVHVAAAAMVRHLLTDPVLPDDLLPRHWPGDALREAYADFAAELVARRDRPTNWRWQRR